jgi:2-dehydro-3-deoxygalactonokinase
VETNPFRIVAEMQNSQGISSTHSAWQQNGPDQDRFLFYSAVVKSSISQLETSINFSLTGVPIVLSGMASSSLGMVTLPYKQIPFKTDGSDLEIRRINSAPDFPHDVIIISGVCSEVDVMRGEETQLVGSVETDSGYERVYIFPGTHSKHITVQENLVTGFKTYMTGEIFALLSTGSTLAEAVQGAHSLTDEESIQSFRKGVEDSIKTNLLNGLFRVRTRFLLQKCPAKLNHSYLSGLLIGSEVKDLVNSSVKGITLVSSSMTKHYEITFQMLQISVPVKTLQDEEATIRGQLAIVSRHAMTQEFFKGA